MKKFDYFTKKMILFENIPFDKQFIVSYYLFKYSFKFIRLDFGYMWNGQILIVALNLGTLAYGGHLVMNNRLNVSNFISFILYQQRLGDILDVRNFLLKIIVFKYYRLF